MARALVWTPVHHFIERCPTSPCGVGRVRSATPCPELIAENPALNGHPVVKRPSVVATANWWWDCRPRAAGTATTVPIAFTPAMWTAPDRATALRTVVR
jgi:hypothetical protein